MMSGFGMLLFPVGIFFMVRKDRSPVRLFVDAGAVSENSARRPARLGIERVFMIKDAEKRGLLVSLGDGRYYVDIDRYRAHRRRVQLLGIVIGLALGALVYFMLKAIIDASPPAS